MTLQLLICYEARKYLRPFSAFHIKRHLPFNKNKSVFNNKTLTATISFRYLIALLEVAVAQKWILLWRPSYITNGGPPNAFCCCGSGWRRKSLFPKKVFCGCWHGDEDYGGVYYNQSHNCNYTLEVGLEVVGVLMCIGVLDNFLVERQLLVGFWPPQE